MRCIIHLMFILSTFTSINVTGQIYTGSTPASPVIRSFLGIPITDSIDFIRWKLEFNGKRYNLHCNYGIGKPNTNGFFDGGKKTELNGALSKAANDYLLKNGSNVLNIVEINEDLLQLADNNKKLLVGNGGWSYTLNNISPNYLNKSNLITTPTAFKDSMVFDGRTPCGVPGVIEPGRLCYKLKWRISLYTDAGTNTHGKYRVLGTGYRAQGGRMGDWIIANGIDGKIIYRLKDEGGHGYLYLLKLDDHILVFTDAEGKLLVGNEDFSYTMNRIR
jgi:hypothetical protein